MSLSICRGFSGKKIINIESRRNSQFAAFPVRFPSRDFSTISIIKLVIAQSSIVSKLGTWQDWADYFVSNKV